MRPVELHMEKIMSKLKLCQKWFMKKFWTCFFLLLSEFRNYLSYTEFKPVLDKRIQ